VPAPLPADRTAPPAGGRTQTARRRERCRRMGPRVCAGSSERQHRCPLSAVGPKPPPRLPGAGLVYAGPIFSTPSPRRERRRSRLGCRRRLALRPKDRCALTGLGSASGRWRDESGTRRPAPLQGVRSTFGAAIRPAASAAKTSGPSARDRISTSASRWRTTGMRPSKIAAAVSRKSSAV